MNDVALWRRLLAELLGSAFLAAVVIGSGIAARTGLRDREAAAAGFAPVAAESGADDHKAYYPGGHRITDARSPATAAPDGLLGGAAVRASEHAEIAKRTDIAATAIFHGMTADAVSDLDLSYTPPLGSPWDSRPDGRAQAWARATRPR